MKVLAGESSREIILEFDTPEEYEKFFEDADRDGRFTVPASEISKDVFLRARASGSPRSRKIKPLKIESSGKNCIVHIEKSEPIQQAPPEKIPDAQEIPSSEPSEIAESDALASTVPEVGKSLFDQIRELTMSERVALALKADLMERRILMQENNSKINEFLLRNVRITEQEIVFIARNPALPMQNLLMIAGNRAWMNHDPIRAAILTNPRTPAGMVMDMIPTLSPPDLLKMHHAAYLRDDVKATVRREMKKRGIKVRENL